LEGVEEVVKALEELGGKASSAELLEKLAPKLGAARARTLIAEAVRKGIIKKEPCYECEKELFVLQNPKI